MRDEQREAERIQQFLDLSKAYRAENPDRGTWRGVNLVVEALEDAERKLRYYPGRVAELESAVRECLFETPLLWIICLRIQNWWNN